MDLSGLCVRLPKNEYRSIVYVLILVVVFDYLLFPLPILANNEEEAITPIIQCLVLPSAVMAKSIVSDVAKAKVSANTPKLIPVVEKASTIINHGYHSLTAYNSEAAQTDDDPCTTANGFNLCKHNQEDSIAANFLKFGTKVRIPELFGDREFVVRDRMNSRYPDRLDVWFKNRGDALKFGVRYAKIEVVK
ncbi:MAG: hypothetical protein WCK11_04265 [Candidatus Falkowbacteria bacterium]